MNGHSNGYGEPTNSLPQEQRLPPVLAYSESDPWNSAFRNGGNVAATGGPATTPGGSTLMGGLPSNWWNAQKSVTIIILPEKQGFILNRYTVYVIQSDVRISFPFERPDIADPSSDLLERRASQQALLRVRFPLGLPRQAIPFPDTASPTT